MTELGIDSPSQSGDSQAPNDGTEGSIRADMDAAYDKAFFEGGIPRLGTRPVDEALHVNPSLTGNHVAKARLSSYSRELEAGLQDPAKTPGRHQAESAPRVSQTPPLKPAPVDHNKDVVF